MPWSVEVFARRPGYTHWQLALSAPEKRTASTPHRTIAAGRKMTERVSETPADGPLSFAARIDRACDQFEREWRSGRRPDLDAQLLEFGEAERSSAFEQLIAIELIYRRIAGDAPSLSHYEARFPQLVEVVRAA